MPSPDDGIPGWDRARLAQGLQSGDSRVLIAFYSHFRPILSERAEPFGIPPADCPDAVETFLGDMLLHLCSGVSLPKSLHGYVFISFKRFAGKLGSADSVDRNRREEFHQTTSIGVAPDDIEAVEYDPVDSPLPQRVAEQRQSDWSGSKSNAMSRFALALLAGLSREERFILGAKAEEMPLREIATLLGLKYNAANTKLFRLRAKLVANAPKIVAMLEPQDRPVVERFLRRARASVGQIDAHSTRPQERAEQRRLNNG